MGDQLRWPGAQAIAESFAATARYRLGDLDGRVVVAPVGTRDLGSEVAIVVAIGDWESSALDECARGSGLTPAFTGTAGLGDAASPRVPVVILDRWDPRRVGAAPEDFEVLAIVTAFNECDIVEQLLDRLLDDGIRVHVIDNWSTDGTDELVAKHAERDAPRVTMERFPAEGPSATFELGAMLRRVEEVAARSSADWIVHHDVDEVRESPWEGVSLRDGLWAVDRFGFNAVDHTIVNFRPVDDSFAPGDRLEDAFGWFEFGDDAGSFRQLKAWRRQPEPVAMAYSGGHDVVFPGRRVFPYKFLLRHYPIRSQAHGERKVLRERRDRFDPVEHERGWHVHYDHFDDDASFLGDPAALLRWDEAEFRRAFLLERLSGAGLAGNPGITARRDAIESEFEHLRSEAGRVEAERKRLELLLAATEQARLAADQERARLQQRADGLQSSIEEMRGSERWRIGGLAVAPVARVRQWFDRNRHHD